jgi:hypothetical protein
VRQGYDECWAHDHITKTPIASPRIEIPPFTGAKNQELCNNSLVSRQQQLPAFFPQLHQQTSKHQHLIQGAQ